MGFNIEGVAGGGVNARNGGLEVTGPEAKGDAGYFVALFENDDGTVTGVPTRRSPLVSDDLRLAAGLDTPLFDYAFNATAHNTALFRHVIVSAMTATMGSGTLLLNSGSTLTAAAGCQHTTWKYFPLLGSGGLSVEQCVSFTAAPLANQIVEFGLFPHGAAIAPVDGAYFRYTSAGLIGVVNYNGTETESGVLMSTADIGINLTHSLRIKVNQRQVTFLDEDAVLGSIPTPNANGQPFVTAALPWSCMFRNSALVSGAPVMQAKISSVHIEQRDVATAVPRAAQQAGCGLVSSQGQSGGTMGSTARYTNSLAAGPGAAIANATAAAGFVGLGGQFAVQPTLAVGTDGILCSYQNPVGSATQTPRTLFITGVRIQGLVTTALTGGAVLYAYSLAYGHTAVSLANAETGSFVTSTAKAPRRVPLGFEVYAANAAVGVLGSAGTYMPFKTPIPVNPGEFVAIAANNLGVATSAGVINVHVTFDGYWE